MSFDGFPPAGLLTYKGLYAHPAVSLTAVPVTSPEIVSLCLAHFLAMAPLQQWLAKL